MSHLHYLWVLCQHQVVSAHINNFFEGGKCFWTQGKYKLNSHNVNEVIHFDNTFMILVVLLLNKFVFAIAEDATVCDSLISRIWHFHTGRSSIENSIKRENEKVEEMAQSDRFGSQSSTGEIAQCRILSWSIDEATNTSLKANAEGNRRSFSCFHFFVTAERTSCFMNSQ